MKQLKKLLALCLVLAMLLTVLPVGAMAAEAKSGTYGNLTWTLDSNGTLTIKGKGQWPDHLQTTGEHWDDGSVKKAIIEKGITTIGVGAFWGCEYMTSVDIPEGVTSIGQEAFMRCKSLSDVNIPDGVTSIGEDAFNNCWRITALRIPNSVKAIGDEAFCRCKSLTRVTLPEGIAGISDFTFSGCSVLTSVTIPNSVKKIGKGAFEECRNLTTIVIPNCVTSIGKNAFLGCTNLWSVTIPDNVTNIGEHAFGFRRADGPGYQKYKKRASGIDYVFTISGSTGSAAEKYAKENSFHFKALNQTATPAIKTVQNVNGGVKLTWGKVSGAAKYRVFVKNGSKWVTLGDTAKTSFVWKKAKSGTKYTFTVRCVSADGKSYVSAYNKTGKTIRYIAAPVLSKVQNTKQGVQVTWKKSAGAVKYRIFRKTASGWKRIGDTNKLFFVDKTAKKGVKYTYTVRCTSANGKTFTSSYDAKGKSIKR